MRRTLSVLAAAFCIMVQTRPAPVLARGGFVSTSGRDIIGPDGRPILLKGINLGNWLEPEGYMFGFREANSPRLIDEMLKELIGPDRTREFWKTYRDNYITRKDIYFIKSVGFNSVRLPFDYRLLVHDDNPLLPDPTGFDLLDSAITWCDEAGLWVILDMHCAPGGQTGDNIDDSYGYPFLFQSEGSRALTMTLWQRIADKFKDRTAVLGYDLLNEPIAPYFDVDKLNPILEPLYKEITKAIRTVDTNHVIILGGSQWDTNFKIFGKPFDKKVVYTFHKYWSDTTESVIREYLDFRENYDVPVWLGESGENNYSWIGAFRRLLERNNIGWCFWPYKKLDATTCIVSIRTTREFGEVQTFADKDRSSFEKIRKDYPSREVVDKALRDYLDDLLLVNCEINQGYLRALGLGPR